MPELKEVFDMVTKQTEPDVSSWNNQERRQRRSVRNRKIGAFAVVAALFAVAAIAAITLPGEDRTTNVGTELPTTQRPGVYLVDASTGEATLVPGIDPAGSSFDVSPDGTMMTFSTRGASGEAVNVADVDGSNVRTLEQTTATGQAIAPRWSPDGSTIVYQRRGDRGFIGDLFIVDVETGVTTRLTDLPDISSDAYYMAPTYTPDGEAILFSMPRRDGANVDLWSVPATGGDPTLVRRNAVFADVSPDGRQIGYVELRSEGPGDLFVAQVDGSDPRRLADGVNLSPRWSPDGTMIVYQAGEEIHAVDMQTGEISTVSGQANFPEWVDGDTLIIDRTD
jgi:Tol biopolymer transport system component